ncbi:hypothetical protein ASB57_07660 [Bordetella sp. N]|nr:hypothetical protein ASB57_07660 [Bordetella sp. N]
MPAKIFAAFALACATVAYSSTPFAESDAAQQEINEAGNAAARAAQHSGVVRLGDQATITLPPNVDFVPRAEAQRLMQAWGNAADDSLMGFFISPVGGEAQWIIPVFLQQDGHIRDDNRKQWDAGKLLETMGANTRKQNEARRARGMPEAQAPVWLQAPKYDAAKHRLVWAVELKLSGDSTDGDPAVNYNTFTLGREGYVALNLQTSKSELPKQIPVLTSLLNSLSYNKGKCYTDFNSATDKIDDYTLSGLMGSGSPAK